MVEMALTAPLLLALVMLIAEGVGAVNSQLTVVNIAREASRLAAQGPLYTDQQIATVAQVQGARLPFTTTAPYNGRIVITRGTIAAGSSVTATVNVSGTVSTPLGSASSRFTWSDLQQLFSDSIASSANNDLSTRSYLNSDHFVLIEVFFQNPTITQFFVSSVPLYSYSIMHQAR